MNADQTPQKPPLRQLTAQEFIDIITEVDKERYAEFYFSDGIVIKDIEINEKITLGNEIIVTQPLTIISGTFKAFVINGCTFKKNLLVGGGTFTKELIIING